jgi:hypothetical protein
MANWCSNHVCFTGEEKNIENLNKLFEKTIDMEKKTEHGQILFGLEGVIDGYMCNTEIIESSGDSLCISFESKWGPIPFEIVRTAELFNLKFEYDYEESGNNVHGKYTFIIVNGESILYDQTPTNDEIESCKFHEEGDDPDEMNGFNWEKLESLIEQSDMEPIQIVRIKKQPA